ncbi:hypothetical protein Bbelb_292990 [Branchiostoma belcheri]|nr:hypothetical protein Bbelb_292990 [Branchiostoma belcheri]
MAMQRGDEMVTRVCGYSLECTVHGGATSDKITVTRWSPGGDSVQGVRIFTTFYSNRWYNEASLERWVPRFEVAKHSIYGRPPGVYMYDAGIEGIPIRLNLVFCHPNADTRRWVADRQHTHVERGKNGVAPVVFTEALELSGVSEYVESVGVQWRGERHVVVGKFAKGRQVGTAPDSMSDNNKQSAAIVWMDKVDNAHTV